jgi:predicted outer membrane repeat protein
MYFFGIALNITNTSFRTNYATVDGGALWTSSGEVSISDFSEFISNRAGNDGGAIYQVSSNGYLNIDETTFTSNYARRDGGAICTNGADVNITGSNLISNTAGRFGGGYYNVNGNSNLLISRSTLNYNYANQGGAVYTKSNSTLITYSTLNGNYAYNTGGAVYQTGYGYLTINRSNLTGNAAYYSGGAVYTTVGTTVEYSTFTDSVAENYVGGAICNEGPELRVFHSNFIGNTAMVYGAAIYNYEHGRLVVASSSFINNTGVRTSNKANYALVNIEDQVGAIANFGRAEITGAYFTGNALCILDNGNMFVTASNFTANRWAFLLNGTGSYVFGNTIVDNNLAFNVTGKDTVIEYNRIVVPFGGKALFNFGVNTDADYNWWGQNDFRNLIYGINLRNWFVMYLQTDIQPHNFANPGTVLSYTYHFELNTKDPWFYKYLPEFYVDLDINGNKYSWLATGVAGTGIYHWDIYFTNTNYYYASAQLDHEISGFNVNNYSTIIKAHSYNARIGETVNLTATLTDAYGTPMINRKVTFYINGTIVGSAYTDLDGVARLPYKATRIGNFSVNAYFAGDKYSAAYYITDPPITGVDWYKAIASYSGFLKVNNDSFRIVGKFDTGKVNGSNVNVSSRVGSSFNFLYTVTNKNPGTVELVIKMVIPAGLKYVKSVVYDQKGNVITNASISKVVFNKKTNTLTWYLAATGSASINITFKSLKVGKYTIKPVITSKDANLNVSAGRLNIDVKAPDLIISKVKKVNGVYQITVKNIGSATAGKSVLRFVCGCKEYSVLVDVKSLAPGKSTTVTSKFPTGGRDHVKFVIANYNKKIVESNYKNNKYRLGRV